MHFRESSEYSAEVESLCKKLKLRLALTSKQESRFRDVLMSYEKVRSEYSSKGKILKLFKINREMAIEFAALDLMKDNHVEVTPELHSYAQGLISQIENILNVDSKAKVALPWNQNSDILDQLNEEINIEQQNELAIYLEEQSDWEMERKIQKRANQLVDNLGLDEVERSVLLDFLKENPSASNEEVADILAPELRELMQKK